MVGVCMKYFNPNYGSMLQALAVVTLLDRLGVDYELIRYQKKWTLSQRICSMPRLLNRVLLNDKYESFLKKAAMVRYPEYAASQRARREEFLRFEQQWFTRLSPVFEGYDSLCEGAARYSAVLSGSDQLWSPAGLPTNFYNLMFVPAEIPKVSWASSFGVGKIPWYQRRRTAQYLERIEHISMRENRGAALVEELIGRQVPVLMDPVFALERSEWDALIEPTECEGEPYIFCCFLGPTRAHREAVEALARKTGRKILTLRHLDRFVKADESFGDQAPYDVGPQRFLQLLRNADYVCTDSFHCSAFSVLYEKPFAVFNRYRQGAAHSKNSRIDTLCENLGLAFCRWDPSQDLFEMMQRPTDYGSAREALARYRQETLNFLKNTLTDA